eukprot:c20430_g1_i1.p1 GENE.c20430_g1_i1~~c20430_g1_i1.p1  ORF type:complete len:617 (-),score=207.53 c20430_g1_i1:45-1856(-)
MLLVVLLTVLVNNIFVVCIDWVSCPLFSRQTKVPNDDIRVVIAGKKINDERNLETYRQMLVPFRNKALSGNETMGAQCALVSVPLYYAKDDNSNDSEQTIKIFIKRVLFTPGQVSDTIVFRIQGGPGLSSEGMENIFNNNDHHKAFPAADVYLIDHRGTGRSNYIGCTNEENMTLCAEKIIEQYGQDAVNSFSPTGFAMDLERILTIIEDEEGPKNISLYAVSYGTLAVHRFLTIFPDRVQDVVLDGVVSPLVTFGSKFDISHNTVLLDTMRLICNEDKSCASALNCSAEQFFKNTMEGLKSGTNNCFEKINRAGVDYKAIQTLYQHLLKLGPNFRNLIPIFTNLFGFCNNEGVSVLQSTLSQFIASVSNTPQTPTLDYTYFYDLPVPYQKSDFLYFHITASEFNPQETYDEYIEATKNLYVTSDLDSNFFSTLSSWPRLYKNQDQYVGRKCTKSTTNVLILNGDMDGQTPDVSARYMYDNLFIDHKATKFLNIFNYAPHGIVYDGAAAYNINSSKKGFCGMTISANWFNSYEQDCNINTSCLSQLLRDNYENLFTGLETSTCNVKQVSQPVVQSCTDIFSGAYHFEIIGLLFFMVTFTLFQF